MRKSIMPERARPHARKAPTLRRDWAGRTEYGQDWYIPLTGPASHLLTAGTSGAGKNSVTWDPLILIAPAIRDGLVRVSGIDPKGMELAYGRRIFHRYAITGTEAVALLDELVAAMDDRKVEFVGRVRVVPITRDYPLELLEFDEIGALTKYTERKTREAITE
jgi:S-DNA-T family DNA segregation ATPase FtsK/SpoIIIE